MPFAALLDSDSFHPVRPESTGESSESLDHVVRQLVAKAIVPEGEIIDVSSK